MSSSKRGSAASEASGATSVRPSASEGECEASVTQVHNVYYVCVYVGMYGINQLLY